MFKDVGIDFFFQVDGGRQFWEIMAHLMGGVLCLVFRCINLTLAGDIERA